MSSCRKRNHESQQPQPRVEVGGERQWQLREGGEPAAAGNGGRGWGGREGRGESGYGDAWKEQGRGDRRWYERDYAGGSFGGGGGGGGGGRAGGAGGGGGGGGPRGNGGDGPRDRHHSWDDNRFGPPDDVGLGYGGWSSRDHARDGRGRDRAWGGGPRGRGWSPPPRGHQREEARRAGVEAGGAHSEYPARDEAQLSRRGGGNSGGGGGGGGGGRAPQVHHQRSLSRDDEPTYKRLRGEEGQRVDAVVPRPDNLKPRGFHDDEDDVGGRGGGGDGDVDDFFTLDDDQHDVPANANASANANANANADTNAATATATAQDTNSHRIKVRQKQIDFGYNTLGYARYLELVPKSQRGRDRNRHPRTPDPYQVCSKRSYDGQIRKWRRLLHEYDPPEEEDEEVVARPVVPEARLNARLEREYITPKAMDRYEKGQRAVLVAAKQLGVGTEFLTTSGTDAAASLARTPVVPRAAAVPDTVAARQLLGEDELSPGWTATDAPPRRQSTQRASPAAGAGISHGGQALLGLAGEDGAAVGGFTNGALRGAATGGGGGMVAAENGTTARAEPKLSIYDNWEGDDDDDFGGVI